MDPRHNEQCRVSLGGHQTIELLALISKVWRQLQVAATSQSARRQVSATITSHHGFVFDAYLAKLAISHMQALQRVDMPSPAKAPRLIHRKRESRTPRSEIAKGEVCLNIVKRVVRNLVLLHNLLPRFRVSRILRPPGECPGIAQLPRRPEAKWCWHIAGVDDVQLALVQLWSAVAFAAIPSCELGPKTVVGYRAGVRGVELVVLALVVQYGLFAQVPG